MRATVSCIVQRDGSGIPEENQDCPELLGSVRKGQSSRSADFGESSSSSTFVSYRSGDYGLIYMNTHDLSNDQKYVLLTKLIVPDVSFQFPSVTDSSGRKRSSQRSWLSAFPGLVYSPSMNGGFCKHCVLFGKALSEQALGVLVSRPLTNMRKATEIVRGHFVTKEGRGKLSHARAVTDSLDFIQYMEQRLQPIDEVLNSCVVKQVAENREKIKSILKTVILCGHQNLPLRGHRDDSSSTTTNNSDTRRDGRCSLCWFLLRRKP